MDCHATTAAEIEAWPLAYVEHFGADDQPTTAAAAAAAVCGSALKTVDSLLKTASKAATTAQRRAMIAVRAFKGAYDQADPNQAPPAVVAKLSLLEAQLDQLEPFLTSIVEANEQACAKIKTQESEKAELSAQLAQANKLIGQLTQQLPARAAVDTTNDKPAISAVECLDAPRQAATTIQVTPFEAAVAAVDSEVAVVSESAEEDESDDDASLAGDDGQAADDLVTDDMEAFQQYVLLEDDATMQWSQDQQAANASAFSILSDAITSDMVGCSPDGLCLLPKGTLERSPKLVAHIQAHQGLLLVGASEDAIAQLPLEWFCALDTCKLSLLERRAINMALLAPALVFWLPQFSVCGESAQKFMWFRQHLDSLMELTDDEDPTSREFDNNSDWMDAVYLAVAAPAVACATKDDVSDVSTTSEDEE